MVKVQVRYLISKSSGIYYYQRRIPLDLRHHFQNRIFIRKSLHTSDLPLAASRIPPIAAKDDALFQSLLGELKSKSTKGKKSLPRELLFFFLPLVLFISQNTEMLGTHVSFETLAEPSTSSFRQLAISLLVHIPESIQD